MTYILTKKKKGDEWQAQASLEATRQKFRSHLTFVCIFFSRSEGPHENDNKKKRLTIVMICEM